MYVDTPPASGNCYLFTSLKGPFTALGPSRTYLRDSDTKAVDGAVASPAAAPVAADAADANGTAAAAAAAGCPRSVAEKAAAANLEKAYSYSADKAAVAASAASLKQVWGLLLQAADSLGGVASYHYDLVDVGRQVIAANFSAAFSEVSARAQDSPAAVHLQGRPQRVSVELRSRKDPLLTAAANGRNNCSTRRRSSPRTRPAARRWPRAAWR
eukprot:SAG22_NODE_101_length_20519_cov_15.588002_2_plen_213_part_00